MLKLENERVRIAVNPMGAELSSLFDKTKNVELLWQAGPEWPKHAPVLFPIVGQLFDNIYYYNGKAYTLPRHGFAREKNFSLEEQSEHRLLFRLCEDADTLKVYPFRFSFEITYLLRDNTLTVRTAVINNDEQTIYFSVGGHPAFRVPVREGDAYTDYELVFDKAITAERWPLQKGLIGEQPVTCIENTAHLPLSASLFTEDAMVFKKFPAQSVTLTRKNGESFFRFNLNNCPFLGFWAAKNAAFVCIEPWHGIADSIHSSQDITEKEGINKLDQGDVFVREYSIDLL